MCVITVVPFNFFLFVSFRIPHSLSIKSFFLSDLSYIYIYICIYIYNDK